MSCGLNNNFMSVKAFYLAILFARIIGELINYSFIKNTYLYT